MLIPVRCFTCGALVGSKYETFKQKVMDGNLTCEGRTITSIMKGTINAFSDMKNPIDSNSLDSLSSNSQSSIFNIRLLSFDDSCLLYTSPSPRD